MLWAGALVPHQACLSVHYLAFPGQVMSSQHLLWPNLGSEAPSIPLCSVGHRPALVEVGSREPSRRLTFTKHLPTYLLLFSCLYWLTLSMHHFTLSMSSKADALIITPFYVWGNWGLEMLIYPKCFLVTEHGLKPRSNFRAKRSCFSPEASFHLEEYPRLSWPILVQIIFLSITEDFAFHPCSTGHTS